MSFSLLLILPSPSSVHIRICHPIMAWDLHHSQLSFYRFVFGSLGRSFEYVYVPLVIRALSRDGSRVTVIVVEC